MARFSLPISLWNWGISNDEFVGTAGSFYNSSGVRIREKSKCFYLADDSTSEIDLWSNVTYWDVTAIIWSGTDVWALTKNGYQFDNAGNLDYTKTGEASILNAIPFTITGWVGTTNLVLIGNTKVSRTSHPSNTPKDIDFATLSTPDASTNDTNYRPAVVFEQFLHIGWGNKIDSLSNLWVLSSALTLGKDDTVVSLLNIGDQMLIFTKNKQFYWDGASTAPDRVINWTNYTIQNAVVLQNVVYVVANDDYYNFVFRVDGYSRTLVSIGRAENNWRVAFQSLSTNQIETASNIIYIPSNSSDYGIFTLWQLYPGYPFSLNREVMYTWGVARSLSYSGGSLYYGYNRTISGTLKSCYRKINTGTFRTGGYIETVPTFCGMEGQKKSAVKIKCGYHLTHENTSIKVYYRKDDETSYTLLNTISAAAAEYGMISTVFWADFYKIQFKIELLTTTDAYSPEFYDLTLIFDTTENER